MVVKRKAIVSCGLIVARGRKRTVGVLPAYRPPAPYRVPAGKTKAANSTYMCGTGGTIYSIKKSAEGDAMVVMLKLLGTMLRRPPLGAAPLCLMFCACAERR